MSTSKFKVKRRGRDNYDYIEDGKTMKVHAELLDGRQFDVSIYRSSLKSWEPPNQEEELSEEAKARIRRNIIESLPHYRIQWM